MNQLWLFLHFLGFTMWLGGALAAMVAAVAAKGETRTALGAVVRAQAAMHRALIGPGAILTVLSGLILTFRVMGGTGTGMSSHWLMLMQGVGIVGALLVLFIAVPTAVKLGRLDPEGATAPLFDELRRRQRVVGSLAGMLGLVALIAGAMMRYGW